MGVVGFEPTQPKHQIYSLAQLSNVGVPPVSLFGPSTKRSLKGNSLNVVLVGIEPT